MNSADDGRKSPDQILEMAAKNKLKVWFEFHNVIVEKVKKKKKPIAQLVEAIVRPNCRRK